MNGKDESCTVGDLAALAERAGSFATIYADPPWRYGNQVTRASTDNHYCTMMLADIAALPIADLAAANAHLHLWTTNGFLFEAHDVIKAWGFTYKSCLVWVKDQMGLGNYWRVSHEFLLLGVRGKLTFADRAQKSWIKARRGRHSSKPDKVRQLIEKVSPAPRLELFGREPIHGWTVWGNEISRENLYTHAIINAG